MFIDEYCPDINILILSNPQLTIIFQIHPLIRWVKQWHKPPMTGNGKHTKYKHGNLGDGFNFCFTHIMGQTIGNKNMGLTSEYSGNIMGMSLCIYIYMCSKGLCNVEQGFCRVTSSFPGLVQSSGFTWHHMKHTAAFGWIRLVSSLSFFIFAPSSYDGPRPNRFWTHGLHCAGWAMASAVPHPRRAAPPGG